MSERERTEEVDRYFLEIEELEGTSLTAEQKEWYRKTRRSHYSWRARLMRWWQRLKCRLRMVR